MGLVLADLQTARRDIARHLAGADPDRVTTTQAATLVALFAEIERLGAAGKVLFAARASQSLTWRDEGHRSAASWMAQKTGTGLGEALGLLETAEALTALPETSAALRQGELSSAQLKVIAAAAATRPRAESALVQAAVTGSFSALKASAAQVRAGATSARDEQARYRAIAAARCVRHWVDPDGAFRLEAKLTPDAGAQVLSVLDHEADARFRAARRSAEYETPAAYRADALVALVTGEALVGGTDSASSEGSASEKGSGSDSAPGSRPPRATVCIRVDASALTRGYVHDGETCVIAGVGPVPVAAVRSQLSDAWVKILVTKGKDVTTVCHVGRTIPVHLQSALDERDPVCVVPGCDVAHGLENHHWDVPYAACKTSTLAGLGRVCAWHHGLLSYEGYVLARVGGTWEWRAPPGGSRFETGGPLLDTG